MRRLVVITFAALVLMAPKPRDLSPHPRFRVEIDGTTVGSFTALDGPGLVIEVLEFREGGDPITRKIPGRTTWSNITLKRGYVDMSFFETWIHQVREGTPNFRKNISILLLDDHGAEQARYNLFNCWPTSWKLSNLERRGKDVLTEEVVIAIEFFERV